jgi:eukaryotic-like serine/threonine-protein kinase
VGLRDGSDGERAAASEAAVAPGKMTALIARLACAPTDDAPRKLAPGARAGRYEIIRAIGSGGFGTVYEAHDGALNRLVALKVLRRMRPADPAVASEAEVAARLAHPNIAALHDTGVLEDGSAFLVYEILHGETLESRLARGPMPADEAASIAAQVARALAHAHAHGVVHRDLKPANVFLTAEGDVKVLDFGVALLLGRAAPSAGTPAYMAPEQRRGEAEDARTDLYALGVLLREMCTGAGAPAVGAFRGDRLPPPVRRTVTALLAEAPAARPRSARAVAAELEAAARALGARRRGWRRLAVLATALALAAAAVAVAVVLRARSGAGVPAPGAAPSIAVLPFVDLSPQRDQQYFADGIADEILNALANVEGLRVPGRTSSFSFKDGKAKLADIGRELNVAAVLEGSVRKEGTRVRVTAEVVDVARGYQLWSETYDRELKGIFAVQDDISRAVVEALKVKLLPGHAPGVKQHRTTNPDAYNAYLLGRHFFDVGTPDGMARAVVELEKALRFDRDYAPAWAWLAVSILNSTVYLSQRATPEEIDSAARRALAAADRAVALAPDLADCWSARAWMRTSLSWDWAGARADFERALALNPRDANILLRQSQLLAVVGQLPHAIAVARKVIDIDPLYAWVWEFIAGYYNASGQPELAREAASRAIEIAPEHMYATRELGLSLLLLGRPADALAVFQRHRLESIRLAGVAMAEHDLGNAREEQRALDTLRARFGEDEAYQIALVYAWRGDADQAIRWLDRAVAKPHKRGVSLLLTRRVKIDPFLRKIRGDPRYAAVLAKMSLPVE